MDENEVIDRLMGEGVIQVPDTVEGHQLCPCYRCILAHLDISIVNAQESGDTDLAKELFIAKEWSMDIAVKVIKSGDLVDCQVMKQLEAKM